MRAMNAEVTARLLSTQAARSAAQAERSAAKEIEALQRALGRAASTETGKHPTVT